MNRFVLFILLVFIAGCNKQGEESVPIQEIELKVNVFFNKMNRMNYQDIYDNELSKKFRGSLSYHEFNDFIGFFHSALGDYESSKLQFSKLRVSSKEGVAYFVKYNVVFNKKPAVVQFVYLPIETESCNGLCLLHLTFTM